ncbi:MAG: hypothetical protein FD145_712 [Candidatus Saganbacteria bacterium]|uniref:Uncharacterized protein n=1 Tax=Candidatus Saganbacteria bacterium TaxID=2575572 RepID=A0A833NX37_UNCSA|nr:MAG: hypothetical protein FD145_712 [Candidatus Saganbacteria bacterium]
MTPPITGQIAPSFTRTPAKVQKANPVAVPGKPVPPAVERLKIILGKLFGVRFYDKNSFGEWLEKNINPDGTINIDSKFKEALAKALGVPANMITDTAMDYFFGNQDGLLNAKDKVSISKLISQLEFLVPIHTAQAAGGGDNAFQYLQTNNILIIDFKQDRLASIDFKSLAREKNGLFLSCFRAAARAYFSSNLKSPGADKKVQDIYSAITTGKDWDGKVPDELKPFLLAAYYGAFKRAIASQKLDLPTKALQNDPRLMKDFFDGHFANFIEGHSGKDPQRITHDLPKDMSTGSIMKAAIDRPKARKIPEQTGHLTPVPISPKK